MKILLMTCAAFVVAFIVASVRGAAARSAKAEAATYVVDQNHAAASDSNPGTAKQPFQTIGKAAAVAAAGDTVLIQPGVYREAIALKNPGAQDKPIVFQAAAGPGTVVITGAEGLTGWQKEGGEKPIYSVSWAYDFFRNKEKPGIEARMHGGRQDDPATKLAELVIWNSRPLRQVLAYDQLQPGNFHVDREKDRLAVWPPGGLDPSANRVEAAARSALFAPHDWRQQKNKRDFTTVPYITIKGLTFRYAANFPQEGMVITGKGWRLEDCVVEWCNGVGLQVHGDDVVLLGCIGQDNGQMGIGGSSGKNILVKDCTVRRNNWKGFNVSWEQDRRINQRRRRSEYARR